MLFSWLEYIFTASICKIILWPLLLYSIKAFYTLAFVANRKLICDTITSVCFAACLSIINTRRLANCI